MKPITNTILLAAALAALAVAGCASDAPTGDDLAGESAGDGEPIGKIDASSTFT